MKKDDRKKGKDAAVVLAEFGTNLVFGPAGSAAVKVFDRVLMPIAEHVVNRRERRGEQFVKEIVEEFMNSGYPQETAVPLLRTALERAPAETKDAVFDAVRALDEVLSDAVVPALALLTRSYVRAGRPKDRFFVKALRLLRDLNDFEFEALQGVVAVISNLWPNPEVSRCTIAKANGMDHAVLWVAPHYETIWEGGYDGLFAALVATGFADILIGVVVHPSQQQGWLVEREDWLKLSEIIPSRRASSQ